METKIEQMGGPGPRGKEAEDDLKGPNAVLNIINEGYCTT